jgi:DNA replication licensing factor MCM2
MYARDRVHPQLHDTDSEKLMELYAHLRKESLATGSFPVTVRHFESTIRMAEASAKMHLRDVVTSSDINLAIKVTVGSFISAQKMSIKKTLERVRPSCRNRFIEVSLINHSSGVPEIHCA